jgi:hypothetical protein
MPRRAEMAVELFRNCHDEFGTTCGVHNKLPNPIPSLVPNNQVRKVIKVALLL